MAIIGAIAGAILGAFAAAIVAALLDYAFRTVGAALLLPRSVTRAIRRNLHRAYWRTNRR